MAATRSPGVTSRPEWLHPILAVAALGVTLGGLSVSVIGQLGYLWFATIGAVGAVELALYKMGYAQRWSRKLFERDARRKLRKIEKKKRKQLQERAQKALPPPSESDSD